jgi:uncharacterized OB-fold protein
MADGAPVLGTILGAIRRDGDTAPFLDGSARGEFLLRRCLACANVNGPQEAQCTVCGSLESQWIPASGAARVVSWSAVYGKGEPAPYTITVIAELDEGPWWWTQVVGAEPSEMATDRRLQVEFAGTEGGETLPVFRLA